MQKPKNLYAVFVLKEGQTEWLKLSVEMSYGEARRFGKLWKQMRKPSVWREKLKIQKV